jgi:ribosomal protein S9
MTDQTFKSETLNFAARGATQKIGRTPEGSGRSKVNMLKVAEKPAKGKIDITAYLTASPDNKAAQWLDTIVQDAQGGVISQVVDLTPELARALLAKNPENRTISEKTVENYTRDIKHGAWQFNGEPIIVAKDGMMNDGQHRCMAVVISGKPIKVCLIVGVERSTRTTLDQGRIRTMGDYLSMDGHAYSNSLAVTARMVWQWQRYSLVSGSGKYRPTKSEVLDIVATTPKIERSIHAVSRYSIAAVGSLGMMAFCHFAFSVAAPASEAEAFLAALSSGENLASNSPILYARNRLLAEKARLKVGERAELIFKAWNAWRRGEPVKSIAIVGDELPLLED